MASQKFPVLTNCTQLLLYISYEQCDLYMLVATKAILVATRRAQVNTNRLQFLSMKRIVISMKSHNFMLLHQHMKKGWWIFHGWLSSMNGGWNLYERSSVYEKWLRILTFTNNLWNFYEMSMKNLAMHLMDNKLIFLYLNIRCCKYYTYLIQHDNVLDILKI